MGIPYSKQINAAFEEVTPLVAQGFEVLETTRNISFSLAIIQVLTVVLLLISVILLVGILITVNPDLETERRELVTPLVKHMASYVMPGTESRWILGSVAWMLFVMWLCGSAYAANYFYTADSYSAISEGDYSNGQTGDGLEGDGLEKASSDAS